MVAFLNSQEVRDEAGVERAENNEKLPRMLIIEVNERWFKLTPEQRRDLAKQWYTLWRHSVPKGIVSIIEKGSGDAVVNYHPDGKVDLVK